MAYWDSPGKSDEWYTPRHVFDALGVRFDLDVASPRGFRTFVPADRFITEKSLECEWRGFVWMNPPFGGRNGLVPWLDKFFAHGHGIALTPDRTSAPWFREAWARADLVLFTPKLRFHRPDGTTGKAPSNGTALMAAGEQAQSALRRAASAGLGIIARPLPASPPRGLLLRIIARQSPTSLKREGQTDDTVTAPEMVARRVARRGQSRCTGQPRRLPAQARNPRLDHSPGGTGGAGRQ